MVFAVMLSSCSGDDYINAIPESSTLLMSTNTAKLTGVGSQQLLKSLLHFKNIDKTGIDFSANVYFLKMHAITLAFVLKLAMMISLLICFSKLAAVWKNDAVSALHCFRETG